MKNKLLLLAGFILLILLGCFGCSSTKKTVSKSSQEVSKSVSFEKDSVGILTLGMIDLKIDTTSAWSIMDSAYDRVTEEVITEYQPVAGAEPVKVTTRIIKEKGQKKTEQTTYQGSTDSTSLSVANKVKENEASNTDSTGTTVQVDKKVDRKSFLPWWVWLVALAVGSLVVIKRNTILDYFFK